MRKPVYVEYIFTYDMAEIYGSAEKLDGEFAVFFEARGIEAQIVQDANGGTKKMIQLKKINLVMNFEDTATPTQSIGRVLDTARSSKSIAKQFDLKK
jgi:hypothetical protein